MGYSYGTTLGRAYLALFPHRADRFVLDSNTHPGRAAVLGEYPSPCVEEVAGQYLTTGRLPGRDLRCG